MRTLTLAGAAALFAAAPALAQQHQHPANPQSAMPDMIAMHCGGGMEGMMHDMRGGRGMPEMAGMMGMMHDMMGPPTPAMILHHKTDLKLTTAQVGKLETLQKQAEPVCRQHMQAGMEAHKAANALLNAPSPDWNAYTAKMKEATAHMVEGVVPMAKAAVAARDVLTPEQRTALKTTMEEMHKK